MVLLVGYIVPVNVYILLELTGKLWKWSCPLHTEAYLCQTSSNLPCSFLSQDGPWLCNGKKEKWQAAKGVKNVFLRAARREAVLDQGYSLSILEP